VERQAKIASISPVLCKISDMEKSEAGREENEYRLDDASVDHTFLSRMIKEGPSGDGACSIYQLI
jgi:hypothetical protein